MTGGGARTGVPDPTGRAPGRARAGPRRLRRAVDRCSPRRTFGSARRGAPTVEPRRAAERHGGPLARAHGLPQGPGARARWSTHGPREARRELDRLIDAVGTANVAVELWDHGDPLDAARNDALADARPSRPAWTWSPPTTSTTPRPPPSGSRARSRRSARGRCVDDMEGWTSPAPVACLRSPAEQERRFARFPGRRRARRGARRSPARSTCAWSPRDCRTSRPPTGSTSRATSRQLVDEGAIERYGPRRRRARRRARGPSSTTSSRSSARSATRGTSSSSGTSPQFCRRERHLLPGSGLGRELGRLLRARGHQRRRGLARAALRALLVASARRPPDIDVDIESGRREEVHPVRLRPLRASPRRPGRERHHLPRRAPRCATSPRRSASTAERRAPAPRAASSGTGAATTTWRSTATRRATRGSRRSWPRSRPRRSAGRGTSGSTRRGWCICDRPVIEVCPVEWARMEGRSVLQWDKDDCAAIGLVKFDLLGLGMLDALHRTVDLVARARRACTHRPRDACPRTTPSTTCSAAADTVGVFQVESRAQMATLPRLRPRCFYDLVIEVALIRPGPDPGQRGQPLPAPPSRRGAGDATCTRSLEPILARTLGVPLFQEQLMEMAVAVAGFSPAEADELRQAMAAKRSEVRMLRLKGRLYAGHGRQGRGRRRPPTQLYAALAAFANFGFPESHAVSFAHLVYCSAWLKRTTPLRSSPSLLNAQPMGFWSPQSLVADAQPPRRRRRATRRATAPARTRRSSRRARTMARVRLGPRLGARRRVDAVAERIAAGAPWAGQEDLVRRAGVEPGAARGARGSGRARRHGGEPSRAHLDRGRGRAVLAGSPPRAS